MKPDPPSTTEIQRALDVLFEEGDVVEIRAFRHKRCTVSGYFDDRMALVKAAVKLNGLCGNTYVTLNAVVPELLARRANRFEEYTDVTTSDEQIIRRRWLPIDLDPVRPTGISSSDEEHAAAIAAARRARRLLVADLGFPEPVAASSGNGAHVLPRIDLPNDEEATILVQQCLLALDHLISDDHVKVDTTVSNAARIWRLYGTVAKKGDHTDDRPHRLSRLLHVPSEIGIVPLDRVQSLAAMAPNLAPQQTGQAVLADGCFDVQSWIDRYKIPVLYRDDTFHGRLGPGRKWVLERCLWNPEHADKSAWIIQFHAGQISAGCQHNSCSGKGWRELRALVESRQTAPTPAVPSGISASNATQQAPWPDPLDQAAYHGLAGDVVRLIEPSSEADPAAILLQFLTAFGNAVGRSAHFLVESDRHYMKLFSVLVGQTSKARKGTSLGHIVRLFRLADEAWATDHISNGLSSGEGLIFAVRDEVHKRAPVKEEGKVVDYQEVISDEGVLDKRLLCIESEFASTLRVLGREGNTLSAILRCAWDTGHLRTLTKHSPLKSTGAHVSIIGHITEEELRRYLTSTEASNGFGNRFLWCCVRRSKCLPEGGSLPEADLKPLAGRLAEALEAARWIEGMERDETTRQLWSAVYPELSAAPPGLFGSLTSRAEAQTMRLACIYALLDQSVILRRPHLEAALAVWGYCESSVRHIFGDSLGDPVADELLDALRRSPDGLSRGDIRQLFNRHRNSEEITRALAVLQSNGLAHAQTVHTEGRPKELWRAKNSAPYAP